VILIQNLNCRYFSAVSTYTSALLGIYYIRFFWQIKLFVTEIYLRDVGSHGVQIVSPKRPC